MAPGEDGHSADGRGEDKRRPLIERPELAAREEFGRRAPEATASAEPRRPRSAPGAPRFSLKPLEPHQNHLLPLALILSSVIHFAAFTLFLMHPVSHQKPAQKEPMMVRLMELPAGRGGATEGTPGDTGEKTPPKEIPLEKPKNPKTTLPGKEKPEPKQGPSPVASEKPGKALGLGHEGAAGLGGKGVGVILDEPTFMYEWYRARLEDMLKSNWRRPAQDNKKTIAASVHFTISADGQAQDVQIVQSSGNSAFDQSVIRAVYGSVPFPKFPPQYTASHLGVMYTFEMLPEGSDLVPWTPPPKKGKR